MSPKITHGNWFRRIRFEVTVGYRIVVACGLLALLLALPLGRPPLQGAAAKPTRSPALKAKSSTRSASRTTPRSRRGRSSTGRTFADASAGDSAKGEERTVREAALAALGNYNGSIVVVDTSDGRILTMVNQKLALSSGYIPCSTIKLVVGLAALNEGIVKPDTKVWFKGRWFMTMTEGLAISNNVYFAYLGRKLGFERVQRYAREFGLGEKAGWRIAGEQLGSFSATEHQLGVGRMMTFGDGISVTPLQLAAFVAALANGGTLYYLQYPRTQEEVAQFEPKVKRRIPAASWIPGVREGMAAAVKRGTAKRARLAGQQIWGKTGTCSQRERGRRTTKLGWFASYNEAEGRKLAVVVMLRGGAAAYGPLAAEIAGNVYRGLSQRRYYTSRKPAGRIAALGLEPCCRAE